MSQGGGAEAGRIQPARRASASSSSPTTPRRRWRACSIAFPKSFRPRISQVLVCDDASHDATYLVGLGYKQLTTDLPLTVIRHPTNLGYGGNQKAGYRLAIEQGLDIVVLLHGDGQYAPECLAEIVAPLERGECDAVFGSRMMDQGRRARGRHAALQVRRQPDPDDVREPVLGTRLTELHSGYRAYSVEALAEIPFEQNSDGFDFDTQIILQLVEAGKRIVEMPIPTYYGDEICYVNGMKYAKDVSRRRRSLPAGKDGLRDRRHGGVDDEYDVKDGEESSHR